MKITVQNPSSPGAMFSNNTNDVLKRIYDWIIENDYPFLSFREMRNRLASEKGINDNNARNIYPLVRNCDFVSYAKNENISTNAFFTRTGLAYVKLLKTIDLINEDSTYSESRKRDALSQVNKTIEGLVYLGIEQLLKKDSNYKADFKNTIKYIISYGKISKKEFALLLYSYNHLSESELNECVRKYREALIDIEVSVDVRNDINLRNSSGNQRRNEGIEYLTAYGYYTGLLCQAGLIDKNDDYFIINNDKRDYLQHLVED